MVFNPEIFSGVYWGYENNDGKKYMKLPALPHDEVRRVPLNWGEIY